MWPSCLCLVAAVGTAEGVQHQVKRQGIVIDFTSPLETEKGKFKLETAVTFTFEGTDYVHLHTSSSYWYIAESYARMFRNCNKVDFDDDETYECIETEAVAGEPAQARVIGLKARDGKFYRIKSVDFTSDTHPPNVLPYALTPPKRK